MLLNQSKRLTGSNYEQFRRDLPFTFSQLTERFISSDTLSPPHVRDSDLEIQTLLSSPIQEGDEEDEDDGDDDEEGDNSDIDD